MLKVEKRFFDKKVLYRKWFINDGNEKSFMDIDATAGLVNNFHGQNFFQKWDKEAIDCSTTHLTEKLKQFLQYGLLEPLICAWKMELTLIIMLSKTEESFYDSPSCAL